jgi:prepilin-type N-terminal cleavage/methylation domain-containing protein
MRGDARGFTLVELLVALSIGAVVLVGARGLLDGLGAHASAVARAMRRIDAEVNAERTARQVLGNIALAPNDAPTFVGSPDQAEFESWCPSERGGLAPCHARMVVTHDAGVATLRLALSTGQTLSLLKASSVTLRYLADASDGGNWTGTWSATQSPPLAVGATAGSSTLFLRIGERR